MPEFITFNRPEDLPRLLDNVKDGTFLVNVPLLNNRRFPRNPVFGFDFDGTATTFEGGQHTSWQEVKNPKRGLVSDEGIKRMAEDYVKWGRDLTLEGQTAWADSTYNIYYDEQITRRQLEAIGRSLKLRDGFVPLAQKITQDSTGLAVVSYGMQAIIKPALEQTGIPIHKPNALINSGVTLYAEETAFVSDDPSAVITKTGIRQGSPRVLGVNKHEYMGQYARLRQVDPTAVVFIGDAVHDLTAKGEGRGVLIHHRENNHYVPSPEDIFKWCEFVLVSHNLTPLTELLSDFQKPQEVTVTQK